jgi:tRNA A-37 threonylcarbamoyl transferase component Bud32
MNINKAKNFVNYLRKIKPNRNWPTPIEYVGGGANGKVYLTNSGKLMKIGLGSTPREFRPLHILQNTKFVPKFNQKNWAIVPILTKRSWKNKGTYVKSIKNLFKLNNTNTLSKIKKYTNRLKKGYNTNDKRKEIVSYIKYLKESAHKKATVFLMNKINSGKVMTLHSFFSKMKSNNSLKNRFRRSIFEMIKQIKIRGISHGNLHAGNMLVSITPSGKIKLWMIDFGRSSIIPIGMTERQVFAKKQLGEYFGSIGPLSKKNENRNVPVYNGSRANVHMANIHYGITFNRNMEKNINSKRR